MNYEKNYYDYVDYVKTLNRKRYSKNDKRYVYYELHHIRPRSLFPELADLKLHPENGIFLTPREHFLAHYLLMKMYNDSKMKNAFWRMCSSNKKKYYNSKLYAAGRKNLTWSDEQRVKFKKARIGYHWSPEMKQKLSIAHKHQKNEQQCKKIMCVETGVIYSSVKKAKEITKIFHMDAVARGERPVAGGYHWRYLT